MAGTMKGDAPASRTQRATARTNVGMSATPRLPAAMATSMPGRTESPMPGLRHSSRTAASTSSMRGREKVWRTRTTSGSGMVSGLRAGEVGGEVQGGAHAGGVGAAGSGDVEGRAVVDARAEERQPDRDVDAGVEA